jgi:hypothetical protein
MSPKAKAELAREHLERALRSLDVDPIEAVHWLFVALEAAVDSLAVKHGVETGPSHAKRLRAAAALADARVLQADDVDVLELLNEVRKETEYEGEDLDLEDRNLETVAAQVEKIVELAEADEQRE